METVGNGEGCLYVELVDVGRVLNEYFVVCTKEGEYANVRVKAFFMKECDILGGIGKKVKGKIKASLKLYKASDLDQVFPKLLK